MADGMHFPIAKATMEGIAHNYDLMARQAARREAFQRSASRPPSET
jgi:hypothetical protein